MTLYRRKMIGNTRPEIDSPRRREYSRGLVVGLIVIDPLVFPGVIGSGITWCLLPSNQSALSYNAHHWRNFKQPCVKGHKRNPVYNQRLVCTLGSSLVRFSSYAKIIRHDSDRRTTSEMDGETILTKVILLFSDGASRFALTDFAENGRNSVFHARSALAKS